MGKAKKVKREKSKTDVWYTVLAIVIGVCLVFGLGVAILQPTGLMDYISLHARTAIKTANYSVNNAQFTYLTYATYNNYYQTYESYGYTSYLGLDRTKPLSQQQYTESMSWLDYCKSQAESTLKQVMALCETAKADGFELTSDDKATIEESITSLADYAKQNNYSFSSAVGAMYGSKGITKSDIRHILEMQTLASKYAEKLRDSYTYTDEQYDNYFEENKYDYLKADYYSYTVKADYESDATDEEKEAAISAAKNKALELFNKIEGGEDFVAVVMEYKKELATAEKEAAEKALADAKANAAETEAEAEAETETGTDTAEETQSAEEKAVEDAVKALEAITEESVKSDVLTEGHKTTKDDKSEADEWMFADSPAQNGAVKMIAADESATIYQVVKSVYRDEYNTATIRELGLSLSNFTNEDAMKEYAQKIIDDFNAGSDKSGEAFDKLAEKYTTDDISVGSSGQQKETTKRSSANYEEINEWVFSDERKPGDVKMFVLDENGIYITFYEETGRAAWLAGVDSSMRADDLEKKVNELQETYPATVNDKAIEKVQ
ncbi:MAG: hypothetical protein IJT49_09260 [Clostridia bacterium]|nr:hypothetical protein [Clostridia bacterium]